jgi:hypothetical protein
VLTETCEVVVLLGVAVLACQTHAAGRAVASNVAARGAVTVRQFRARLAFALRVYSVSCRAHARTALGLRDTTGKWGSVTGPRTNAFYK